ncbi:hypothetical protein C1645_718480 [Glomus cerebriforme]|uniref:RBR-type E3 ubiquitin transferase n=1 Tax=Glomus cerebriforme TaxID=658196 RepID=A0A397TV32_9GLOM|nr:hypothetical protein C1645_718480 [Glomus cerebriforme]
MMECQICFDTKIISSFSKITANCKHKLNICRSCVKNHITAQLDSKSVEDINCPVSGCKQKFQSDDVKKISKELFERFDGLMVCQTLSKLPEFRWCKNPKCNSGQLHLEGDDAPIITCQACGKKSCYTHDIPWHAGQTCTEYENNKNGNDEETQKFISKETKPCPRCNVRIIKNEGCDHMTCRMKNCNYEFCWLCFADHDKIRKHGNSFHKKSCKYYTTVTS